MSVVYKPIIWDFALARTYSTKHGFQVQLFAHAPQGHGFWDIEQVDPIQSAASVVIDLIKSCPWYYQPHEIRIPDAKLAVILKRRLRHMPIRVWETCVSQDTQLAFENHSRGRGMVARWYTEWEPTLAEAASAES